MVGRDGLWARIWPHFVLVVASVVALYPVLWVLKTALSPGQGLSADPNPFPTEVTFAHFEAILGPGNFMLHAGNSFIVATATAIVGLVFSCTAAYAFSRFRFPGRTSALGAFMLTQIFPGVVMMIPLYAILNALGLLDSLMGLVLVYSTTAVPFCTFMLKGYFDTIPKEIEEAALIDGASQWTIFWRVVLPLSRPALAITALFSFMAAWNEFILAATFINDPGTKTLPVVLWQLVGEHGTAWGEFAAGAILTSLPVMLLFYALQKQLVGGLTSGGVKG